MCTLTNTSILAAMVLTAGNPATAQTLDFKGTALAGSQGSVYPDEPASIPTVSFAGDPVDILITLAEAADGLYVQSFTETWSTASYAYPYILNSGAQGFPDDDAYMFAIGVQSSVTTSASGGAIRIYSTEGYDSQTDGDLSLTLNYTLSSPHAPGSSFLDSAVTGGGSSDAYVNGFYDPRVGLYDADSPVTFSLSSVSEVGNAPEPGTWALMLVGFGLVGAASRSRRSGNEGRAVG